MKSIPINILLGGITPEAVAATWSNIAENWEVYAANWETYTTIPADPDTIPILDLFIDEGISIKSIVKDLSDPKKLFTEYSRSFTVPATKKNNRIFKHYYSIDIINGLDSRELIPTTLLMNNVTYKVGNLQIEGVRMSKGVPTHYKVKFIGKLSELARNIGQDRLRALDFSALDNLEFNAYNALNNNIVGDVVFPLASRSNRFIFDSGQAATGVQLATNIAFVNSTAALDYGIDERQIIGALKVGTIISKIEETYGITFTGAIKNSYISDLYLWLRNTDKERSGEPTVSQATGWVWEHPQYPPDSLTLTDNSISFSNYLFPNAERYQIRVKGVWATGDAVVKMYKNGSEVRSVEVSDNYTNAYLITDSPQSFTFTAESDADITVDLTVEIIIENYEVQEPNGPPAGWYAVSSEEVYGDASIGDAGLYLIHKNLPKMKIMEFLSSIFKMFNIVAEVDNLLNVSTKHFDHFMSDGSVKDVSEYIEISDYEVNRPNLYSAMQMEFADPKVAMEMGYLAVNGRQYGELSYELIGSTGVRLSGTEYKFKVENQRVPVEPLKDLNSNLLTTVVFTQFADLKGAEQSTSPMFTYVNKRVGATPLAFTTSTTVSSFANYIQPCNSYAAGSVTPTQANSKMGLYFGEELSEYHPSTPMFGIGLWNNFYRGTTAMMFDEDKRSVSFNAHFPANILIDLKLSDTLVISNNFYNINSIETNYLTGESKLDLTLVGRSKLDYFNSANRTVQNNSSGALELTYMLSSGDIQKTTISGNASLTTNMVGPPIGYSHSNYTVALN
jgi:hypothetical protein